MTASSVVASARARKNESTILQALARLGQVGVAQAMGVSESTVSRFKNGELVQWASFLAALGLKVVPEEVRCFDPKKIEAILELARDNLNRINLAQGLTWEDEPPDG